MAIRLIIFYWFVATSIIKAQDTLQIEYADLGLPEVKQTYTNEDKYGPDKSQWPVWARKRVTLSMFKEDTIHIDQLTLNDYFLFSFDSTQGFERLHIPDSRFKSNTVIQNNIAFIQSNNGSRFSYFNILKDGENNDVDIIVRGELIDLNDLESVKKHFPNSYAWRDGRTNMLYSGYHPDSTIYLSTLNFLERKTKAYLQLYYEKGRLIYIYGME